MGEILDLQINSAERGVLLLWFLLLLLPALNIQSGLSFKQIKIKLFTLLRIWIKKNDSVS